MLQEDVPDGMWTEIIGLSEGDRVAFAGVCGEQGEALFFTDTKVLRIAASTVRSQQTPSARGVIGIKLGPEDTLLGGAVIGDPKGQQVFILSEKRYIKRVPLEAFPIKGRGTMGVQSLNVTKTTGPVVAAAAGRVTRSTTVDVLAADGKRQRMTLGKIPVENRQKRGARLVTLTQAKEIVLLR